MPRMAEGPPGPRQFDHKGIVPGHRADLVNQFLKSHDRDLRRFGVGQSVPEIVDLATVEIGQVRTQHGRGRWRGGNHLLKIIASLFQGAQSLADQAGRKRSFESFR